MQHGLYEISSFGYVGDVDRMYVGYCLCQQWDTGKDPSWLSAGKRVEEHARGKRGKK